MSEYIKKDLLKLAVINVLEEPPFSEKKFERASALIEVIDKFPAADVVSAEAYEQVIWERDLAIEQLAEYGVSLGEKKKNVEPVVRGEWKEHRLDGNFAIYNECSKCGYTYAAGRYGLAKIKEIRHKNCDFCPSCGAVMTDEGMKKVAERSGSGE